MGEPATYDYMGRTIKFCCAGCIPEFQAHPDMYIAKIDSAATGLLEPPEGHMDMEGHEGHDHGHGG
jgi:hypothetical protein